MNTIIGIILILLALIFILAMVVWSNRRVDYIRESKLRSARQIEKKLDERK